VGINKNNLSQPVIEAKNPSQENAELPDCPDCGQNEWQYSPEGELFCPCEEIKGRKKQWLGRKIINLVEVYLRHRKIKSLGLKKEACLRERYQSK